MIGRIWQAWRRRRDERFNAAVERAVSSRVGTMLTSALYAESDINEETYELAYQLHATVYACVDIISTNFALMPLGIYERRLVAGKMRNVQIDHELNELLEKPNPLFSGFELSEATTGFLELTGNSYWHLGRGRGTNRVKEVVPLRPDRVRINPGGGYVRSYTYHIDTEPIELMAEDVLHFKYFNPHNDYYGQSPLQAGRDAVVNDAHAKRFNTAFFKNGAEVGALVNFEHELPPEQRQRIKHEITAGYTGSANRGKVLVLDGQKVTWQSLGINQREMDFYIGRKTNKAEMASVYGVPPVMLWAFEQANYNTANQQRRQFHEETMRPKFVRRCKFLTTHLRKLDPMLPENHKLFVWFDASQVPALRREEIERMREQNEMIRSGAVTINEVRAERGLEPVAWGDEWYPNRGQVPVTAMLKNPYEVNRPQGKPPSKPTGKASDNGDENARILTRG